MGIVQGRERMTAYYNEHDKKTSAWLRQLVSKGHIADGVVDDRDIQDVTADELRDYTQVHLFAGIGGWSYALRLAGWPDDRPVWTGSCPCQPFSAAGKQRGESDERHLWPEMRRLLAELRPATVFGEQVASLAGKRWLDHVFDDLESHGYACGSATLRACSVGSPHDRPRLYFVADSSCERQSESRKHRKDSGNQPSRAFAEADRLVNAVRRKALPFLCRIHDGVPARVGEAACHGFGNAIVPQVAAEFVTAYMECERTTQ